MMAAHNEKAPKDGQKPIIIAIMGCTGVGKSTFIKAVGAISTETDGNGPVVGDGLESCTAEPKMFRIPGTNIVLIDTPGFNDTHVSDREMLRRISQLLAHLHADKTDIAGMIYLHPINDARVTGSARKNLDMFSKVVGASNMNRCMLVTTKWSCEQGDKAESHEAELVNNPNFWKPMFDAGVKYARFEDTPLSARTILSPLCKGEILVPKVIVEWAYQGKRLHETEAGRAVEDDVEQAKKVAEQDIKEVRAETAEALRAKDFESAKALEKERAELEGRLRKMEDEREKLRIAFQEQRKEEQARWEAQRQEAEARRKREIEAYEEKQRKEAERWQQQQQEWEKKQLIERQQREADHKAWKADLANAHAKKESHNSRVKRRGLLGILGGGIIIATGGLAAPLVAVAAIAHEAKCQDQKQKE